MAEDRCDNVCEVAPLTMLDWSRLKNAALIKARPEF